MKIEYCSEFPVLPEGHTVIIDGKVTTTSKDFLSYIWTQLDFPDEYQNWDAYLDWMRDLSWLNSNDISLVIVNYDSFLCCDEESRNYFIPLFEDVIFPFWKTNAIGVFEDAKYIKNISVYCISNEVTSSFLTSSKDLLSLLKRDALGGQKTPHKLSMPVIRKDNETFSLASFVFFFNREEIDTGNIRRPSIWFFADIKTGTITKRYSCLKTDFSDASYEVKYNICPKEKISLSQEQWDKTLALFDAIRIELLLTNKLNKYIYKKYFDTVLSFTPKEYQRFYMDLSINPDEEI